MQKNDFRNPMTKIFQYEYALYLLMTELFYDVHCLSGYLLETLKLYFMELTTISRSGRASFEKQYALEAKMEYWIKRDVVGNIVFPQMDQCRVEVTIKQKKDGSHMFVFSDGIYAFSVYLKWDAENNKINGLSVIQLSNVRDRRLNQTIRKTQL